MSIDFPRAWELAATVPLTGHHPKCSWRQSHTALLCDCDVLWQHPETLDDVMHTRGGAVFQGAS